MDPRLIRLFELGHKDDEVAAILRLDPKGPIPTGVRVITRFGPIATVRIRRGDIPRVHDSAAVASMKPAAPLLRESPAQDSGAVVATARDVRRPAGQHATGRGVLVGFVDWGFDFAHPDFRKLNGTTRLLALWDQSVPPSAWSPAPYGYGVVHTAAEIDAALATPDPYGAINYDPADSDLDGNGTHGSHVAGIAVGGGRAGPLGIAPDADIVFVQLTTLDQSDPDIADSATVLEAIDFIRTLAGSRPWVVNLSLGQCGDPHDGTTLVEQGLDAAMAAVPGCACVQSTGNYFTSRLHSSGRLRTGERRTLTWRVPASSGTNELEVWYPGRDAFTVSLRAPGGQRAGRASLGERVRLEVAGKTCGELNNRRRDPNNLDNHVVLWLQAGTLPGDWQFTLDGRDVADGRYHLWVQRGGDEDGGQAAFVADDANPFFTTNSICNGRNTVVVGAYDARAARRPVASFSSAGPTRDGRPKPDLLAPGVGILSARSTPAGAAPGGGLLVRMSGTSMAAPHVAGTIALMFEVAPRLLRGAETRSLLLSSAQPAGRGSGDVIRYGGGYLDVDAAVEAAHGIGRDLRAAIRGATEMTTGSAETTATRTNAATAANQPDTNGWSGPLATADTLISIGGPFAASPTALLARVLAGFGDPAAVDPLAAAGLLDPAALFDGFTAARLIGLRLLLDRAFAVVAYPRQPLPRPQPGDILLRRALGEPGLGHVAFIAGQDAYPRDEACRRGLCLESVRPGLYARVVEAGSHPHRLSHRFARRVAGPEGVLPADTLILRPRLRLRMRRGAGGLAEDIDVDRAVHANSQYATQLGWHPRYADILALLGLDASASPQDFAQAVSDWQGQHGLPADGTLGPDTWSAMQPMLSATQAPSAPAPSPTTATIDVDRAVQGNHQYAAVLGWQTRYNDLLALLGLDGSASAQDFARAVANWQGQHGLPSDGILGPDTWNAMRPLLSATAGATPATPKTTPVPSGTFDVDRAVQANQRYAVQLGWQTRSNDVAALLGLGANPAPKDLAQVVARWQSQHNLPVDGIIGPDTWAALRPLLGAGAASTAPAAPDEAPLFSHMVWTDSHGAEVGRLPTFDTSTATNPPIAFGSPEHFDLGEAGVQALIDAWARAGLIAGGAFVMDTDANRDLLSIRDWQIITPDPANPTAPYGDLPVFYYGHWHWVLPNAYYSSSGARWTAESLQAEIIAGKAVTLSIGDIILLSGDLVESFDDFGKAAGADWRPGPVHIMKGFQQLESYAATILRLSQFPQSAYANLKLLERNRNDYNALQQEIRQPDPYWDRIKAVVQFLGQVRGPTGCSELLVLSRVMRREHCDMTILNKLTPWVHVADRTRLQQAMDKPISRSSGVSSGDKDKLSWNALSRHGQFDSDLFQSVVSNGYYGALALRNAAHFSPANWQKFEDAHGEALKAIDSLMSAPRISAALAPIPADAVAQTAFGMHFMTDAFSSGHMRVPRAILGATGGLLSKVMHDIDGKVGLFVKNGFGDLWRAFGDGYLHTRDKFQEDLLAKLPSTIQDTSVDANARRAVAAVASAMKQLHYQAQKYWNKPEAEDFSVVLNANRGSGSALRLDEYAPEGTPGDPGAGRDAWIAMDIPAKIAFLRKHQPVPAPSAGEWLKNTSYNLPELILSDGSINTNGDYSWHEHPTKLFNDKIMSLYAVGDVDDFTELYQFVLNMPAGASWYGNRETGLTAITRQLPGHVGDVEP
jgi:subtilisin family serine protease/peptidoglycan hydrolase-like protein with peptidoglycan-binding domain